MAIRVKHKIEAVRSPVRVGDERNEEGIATWEPGDGTRYQIWFRKVGYINGFGCLGSVTWGWMIVCSLNGRAYLFQPSGELLVACVAEKLGLKNTISAKAITALIGFALKRETEVEIQIVKEIALVHEEVDPRD